MPKTPVPLTAEELAFEIAKRKLAIGQQYKTINEYQTRLRELVEIGQPIEIPQLGKTLTLVDHFAEKDQHWKQVCCERYEAVLS